MASQDKPSRSEPSSSDTAAVYANLHAQAERKATAEMHPRTVPSEQATADGQQPEGQQAEGQHRAAAEPASDGPILEHWSSLERDAARLLAADAGEAPPLTPGEMEGICQTLRHATEELSGGCSGTGEGDADARRSQALLLSAMSMGTGRAALMAIAAVAVRSVLPRGDGSDGSGGEPRRDIDAGGAAERGLSSSSGSPVDKRTAWQPASCQPPSQQAPSQTELARLSLCILVLNTLGEVLLAAMQRAGGRAYVYRFACDLLRSQLLHCCARILAAAAEEARRRLRAHAAAAAAAEGPARPAVAATGADGNTRVTAASTGLAARLTEVLPPTMRLLLQLAELARVSGAAHEPQMRQRFRSAYISELGAALRDSCVLEHAAQALLLEMQLAGAGAEATELEAESDGSSAQIMTAQACPTSYLAVTAPLDFVRVVIALVRATHTQEPTPAAAGWLMPPLSGRCVAHLSTALAVAAVAAVDGGTMYGMPPELARPLQLVCWRHEGAILADGRCVPGRRVLHMEFLLPVRFRAYPPRRRASVDLLLRIVRAALASARLHAEEQRKEADGTASTEGSPSGSTGLPPQVPQGSSDVPAAGSAAASPPPPHAGPHELQPPRRPQQQHPQALLPPGEALATAIRTLHALRGQLSASLGAAGGGWVWAAVAERYRLAAAALRLAPAAAAEPELQVLGVVLRPEEGSVQSPAGEVPASPPPPVVAALEGGLLPCLERLLRRAAEDADGLAAKVLFYMLATYDEAAMWLLTLALSFGEPRTAASLVATLGKALRRVVPAIMCAMAQTAAPPPPSQVAAAAAVAAPHAAGIQSGAAVGAPITGGSEGPASSEEVPCLPPGAMAVLRFAADLLMGCTMFLDSTFANGAVQPPRNATPSAAAQQLRRLCTQAATECLPQLSLFMQGAARLHGEPPRIARPMGLPLVATLSRTAMCLTIWLTYLPPPPPLQLPTPSRRQPRTRGRPAGAADAAAAQAVGSACAAKAGEALQTLLLEEAGAVPLLGAMLRLLLNDQCVRHCGDVIQGFLPHVVSALANVAKSRTDEVRAAAFTEGLRELAAAASSADGARGAGGGSGGGGGGGGAVSREVPLGKGEVQLSYWRPDLLTALGESLQAAGHEEGAVALVVAAQLTVWSRGRDDDVLNATLEHAFQQTAYRVFMPPPEAHGLLRTCGNPGCTNLAGDSEAELPLKACAGCGVVGYCCRECQTAHWRAGHKAECAGRRGG